MAPSEWSLSTTVGWKWVDGERVNQRFRIAGERLPTREQLGDEDLIDTEDDPWQLTRFLYLLDPEDRDRLHVRHLVLGPTRTSRTLSRQIAIRRANCLRADAIIIGVGHKHSKN